MALHWVALGTVAPPSTVGGFTMTAFDNDARSIPGVVTTVPVPSPLSGNLTVSATRPGLTPCDITHVTVGSGWATWSHGYAGDVYYNASNDPGNVTSTFTIDMPANVGAFYFYMEPNAFTVGFMQARANDGTETSSIPAQGFEGAVGMGLYADPGQTITQIVIGSPNLALTGPADAGGFAVGEFGIAPAEEETPPTITFSKTTAIDDPTAEFIITVGPGLDPATFVLGGGDSVTYIVDPEETYFCSEGQTCGWAQTDIVVSSGTADAIVPIPGDDVTVEFQNATTPVIPGENGCAPITTTRRLIRRMRQSPHIANQGQWMFIHNFELWMDTGVGLNGSEGQGSDPMIHLQTSKDGGATWGPSMPMSVGQLGEYRQRVIWWQLGQARDWVFRVTCSDPVAWRLVQAYMDLEPGTS